MAHLVKDEGIVLEMRDHAETDRIVTVFTRYHGKLPILVKGARRLTSGSGAYLDLANRVGLIYYRPRGLSLLKEASLIQTFPSLREDLGKLEVALSGLILARDLLPELQPQSEAYFSSSFVSSSSGFGGSAPSVAPRFRAPVGQGLGVWAAPWGLRGLWGKGRAHVFPGTGRPPLPKMRGRRGVSFPSVLEVPGGPAETSPFCRGEGPPQRRGDRTGPQAPSGFLSLPA